MKTKNFYAVILFLLAAVTTLWILVDPSPSLHTIVSETHKQISNIKNIPSNIRHTKKKLLEVDHKYLDLLGFPTSTVKPVVNKSKSAVLKTDPVIVVPVFSSAFEATRKFLASVRRHLPEKFVVFYDLGLGSKDSLMVGLLFLLGPLFRRKSCAMVITRLSLLSKTLMYPITRKVLKASQYKL